MLIFDWIETWYKPTATTWATVVDNRPMAQHLRKDAAHAAPSWQHDHHRHAKCHCDTKSSCSATDSRLGLTCIFVADGQGRDLFGMLDSGLASGYSE